MLEEYEGAIVEIIFHNNENGYTVAIFETETEAFTVVGNLPSVHVGASCKLRGLSKEQAAYGVPCVRKACGGATASASGFCPGVGGGWGGLWPRGVGK